MNEGSEMVMIVNHDMKWDKATGFCVGCSSLGTNSETVNKGCE
jgi:hypothetical protein